MSTTVPARDARGGMSALRRWGGYVAFVVLFVRRRDLTLYAFDPTHAHAIGLSPRFLSALLHLPINDSPVSRLSENPAAAD